MGLSDDVRFEALYDHYKDTFGHIRDREHRRDRLFLYVIGLLGGLYLFGDYPQNIIEILVGLWVGSEQAATIDLPQPVIISVLWTFLLVALIRYLQQDFTIDRQYVYLHKVEDQLAGTCKDPELFRREGREYEHKYPWFSRLMWGIYKILFPLLVLTTTSALFATAVSERVNLAGYFWYGAAIYGALVAAVLLRVGYTLVTEIFKKKK